MVCLQLGSNKGDRKSALEEAISKLSKFSDIVTKSSIFETEAWGNTDQQDFYNQLLLVETNLNPFELLREVKSIEADMGRVKMEKWGPRIIDIDIIFYDQKVIYTPDLIIPHHLFDKRRFILEPLVEIAKEWMEPLTKLTATQLLTKCTDKTEVKRKEFNVE